MSKSYGIVNLFSSLGFAYFWRRVTVRAVRMGGPMVCDVMAGGGECLCHAISAYGRDLRIDLVDWSSVMCGKAQANVDRRQLKNARVLEENALTIPVNDASYDTVYSAFGLKTLSSAEMEKFSVELYRVMKPGGVFSFLEFSVPRSAWIRRPFRLYVEYYVPFIGQIFLGNPDNYRMLWRYTKAFGSCRSVLSNFEAAGFDVECRDLFLGTATQLVGRKPE